MRSSIVCRETTRTKRLGYGALSSFTQTLLKQAIDDQATLTPLIIPPMLGKASTRNIICRQWYSAIDALRLAAQIWIVGYSFPQTDAFMQRLLHEGLSKNRVLDRLVIADIQPESAWEDRLETLFSPVTRREQLHASEIPARKLLATLAGHN